MKTTNFKTVNFHLTKACNYRCKFCFVTFKELKEKGLSKNEHLKIVHMLSESKKFEKINFTGREPTLVKHLPELVAHAKNLGFRTGIITNGSLLSNSYLQEFVSNLDNLIISIDSFNEETNLKIGRFDKKGMLTLEDYLRIAKFCHQHNIRFKINTVVNRYNIFEILTDKINLLQPTRWKLQQVTKIEGQNDADFDTFKITEKEFYEFAFRNQRNLDAKIRFSIYNDKKVKNSYLLMDPLGRFYIDTYGQHIYSQSVLQIGIENALNEILNF